MNQNKVKMVFENKYFKVYKFFIVLSEQLAQITKHTHPQDKSSADSHFMCQKLYEVLPTD